MVDKIDRTIKAQFDPDLKVVSLAGLFLMERLNQRIGLTTTLTQFLPPRSGEYSSAIVANQVILGLLAGGRGLSCGEVLLQDPVLSQGLGFPSVAEESTVGRVLAELAGLQPRKAEDWYVSHTNSTPDLLLSGSEPTRRLGKRQVKDIEFADPQRLRCIELAREQVLLKLLRRCPKECLRWGRWVPIFGDGNQLEVTGKCFDAARKDRNGNLSEHLAFTTIGPFFAAAELRPGTQDEGLGMPVLLQRTTDLLQAATLGQESWLFLLDSAFGEKQVLEQLHLFPKARYLVGVNGQRNILERLCQEQPASQWVHEPRPAPWLEEASYCTFYYQAKEWKAKETVVAIRYREKGDILPKFTFLLSNLTRKDIRRDRARLHTSSYEATLWAMYRYKQGMENYQKPAVSDLGLHHPPSGRFGINQIFYNLALLAYNLGTFLSRCALPQEYRGMRLWRMRNILFRLAGRITVHARTTTIHLATAVRPWIQKLWADIFLSIQKL